MADTKFQTVENPWGKWDIFSLANPDRTIEVAPTKGEAIARVTELNRIGVDRFNEGAR